MSYIFPNDAISDHSIAATATTGIIIPTSTTPITILWSEIHTSAQNLQQLECHDPSGYHTLAQAIGITQTQFFAPKVFPTNTVCYLKTYDGSLTMATITWVPYDLTSTTSSQNTSTAAAFTNGELVETTFLFIIIALAVGLIAFIGARKRS